MSFFRKRSRILLILLLAIVGFGVFVSFNGIQYGLAFATHGFGKPYFDVQQYAASPNCGGATPCSSGTIKVMSYNVLCRMCAKEGFDNWDARIPHLEEKIAGYDPDLLGVQELGGDQDLDQFLAMFPQYECISYRFGKWAYGDAALFFRADRFEALDSGQFWLSPHPALPFGFAWKPLSMPRYVNWVYLRQKSNDFRFLYLNTHFDNNGPNKETAARFFAKVFRPIAERMPIIATGDFNTPTTSDRYKNIKGGDGGPPFFVDAADLVAKKEVISNIPSGTASHKIEEFIDPAQSIDHVFLAGPNKAEVGRWVEDANVYGPQNRWPSDHPAIYAEVDLKLQ